MSLTIRELQALHKLWCLRNFGPDVKPYQPLLGAVEEIGELAHAHLKEEQGIRGSREEMQSKAKDAVGDIILYLVDYCNRRSWNLEEIVKETVTLVHSRDWTKEESNGSMA